MDENRELNEQIRKLREENRMLFAEIEERRMEIQQRNVELEETNKGVVVLYAELDDKALALRKASELKSRFLSYISHEFRTPLGSIRSLARIVLDRMDGPLTDEQEKQVRFIQKSAVELTEMIDDLLDLAKIEAGRINISPEWFEMVDLFAALRGMFKPLVGSGSVSLVFEEPNDIPRIYTDDKKLSQILRNYISNALKFTQEGTVHVAARREGHDAVTFSVADTGIGIAKEHHAAVFQDFMQIDSPLQGKWRGTGLGLSLSKKMAELLGGSVAMTSELGVGSTFFVTIPIRSDENPVPETSALETSAVEISAVETSAPQANASKTKAPVTRLPDASADANTADVERGIRAE
jgi:signal transduction histidine kinase